MDNLNYSIACDVKKCKHNTMGTNCSLNKVQITCDCSDCTCCGSFDLAKTEE